MRESHDLWLLGRELVLFGEPYIDDADPAAPEPPLLLRSGAALNSPELFAVLAAGGPLAAERLRGRIQRAFVVVPAEALQR